MPRRLQGLAVLLLLAAAVAWAGKAAAAPAWAAPEAWALETPPADGSEGSQRQDGPDEEGDADLDVLLCRAPRLSVPPAGHGGAYLLRLPAAVASPPDDPPDRRR